jgi:Fe-Mn family superoxide dismutase
MLEKLKAEAVGHFSNGWAWLVLDRDSLKITSLHDADTPVVYDGMKPLLTLDVWEHAYYIDYRNARPDFADKVLSNIINWEVRRAELGRRGLFARRSGRLIEAPVEGLSSSAGSLS